MTNLTTKYLGLTLKNPVVASAGPLTKTLDDVKKLEDAGAGAIVLHSLFEEQITLESMALDKSLSAASERGHEAESFFPNLKAYNIGPDDYIEHLRKAKKSVKVPVIASLNGVSNGGWIRYAKMMEDAGADAIELNIYFLPTDMNMTGAEVEAMYCDLVANINSSVRIPLSVKLGPFFSATGNFARHLEMAGADGLVLFNRFYQPDYDLDTLEVVPTLQLSRSNELRLRLHWVAMLYGKISADMAITGGVHTAEDVVKCMMAGARVAMTTSALLAYGVDHLGVLVSGLQQWLEDHEYESVQQMQGSMSHKSVPQPSTYERANYVKVLSSYVIGAGR